MEPNKQNNLQKRLNEIIKLARIAVEGETEYFFQNLAILLISGIDIKVVLKSLKEELRSRSMKEITEIIYSEIESGSPLWKALEKVRILSDRYVSIIKIGEESGRLPENLRIIINQQQKDRVFISRIRSAMTYPAIIFSLLIIIILGIGIFVLPNIANVYKNLKIELPAATQFTINIGLFFQEYGIEAVITTIITMLLGTFFLFIFPKTKHIGQGLLFSFPLTRQMILQMELSRFTYILGSLLNAGLPIDFSLKSLETSTSFIKYQKFYHYLADAIQEGKTFQESFANFKDTNRMLPISTQQMIITGEKTGNLSNILIEISAIYENKSDQALKNLTVLLEPFLLIAVWIGVAFFAISIITPVYNLIGGFDTAKQNPLSSEELPNSTPVETPGAELIAATPSALKIQVIIVHEKSTTVGLRKDPAPLSEIVAKVDVGKNFTVLKEQDGWYQIQNEANITGWVPSQNVQIKR
ncbi:MAG TPA: type II secretion system F family protein [Candidatus Dojkabacteria bacterium]|nr:type II secretion system F family protein [Candidatus Dojkabacteria bacterium]